MTINRRFLILFMLMGILVVSMSGCTQKPIKIGFIGSLSAKNSQLSIDARNSIQLLVKKTNEAGGVLNRNIELIIKDDKASVDVASEQHKAFMDEGVSLVIGHMTSNMSNVVLTSQSERLMFLSPSMGSPSLTGIDDYFLRISPLTNDQAYTFFEIVKKVSAKRAVVVYDLMNADYAENLAKNIQSLNMTFNETELILLPFDSRSDDVQVVAEEIMSYSDIDLVFMIAQAADTAVLSQRLKRENDDLSLASVSWSMTQDLIINGGPAVDGMYFVGVYKSKTKSEEMLAFETAFFETYGYMPSFICFMTYDTFYVLVEAMEESKSTDPKEVKEAIINKGMIQGIDEDYSIDTFGDSSRNYLVYRLLDGEFIPDYK